LKWLHPTVALWLHYWDLLIIKEKKLANKKICELLEKSFEI
jgi:hypothetical protein